MEVVKVLHFVTGGEKQKYLGQSLLQIHTEVQLKLYLISVWQSLTSKRAWAFESWIFTNILNLVAQVFQPVPILQTPGNQ